MEHDAWITLGTVALVVVALATNKIGFGLGYTPYSRVSYRVERDGEILPNAVAADTAAYTINFKGNGGLQKLSAGLGYRIHPNFSIGLSADFIFGIIEENRITSFDDPRFRTTSLTNATRMDGITATLGTLIRIPNIVNDDLLTVAATA